jgi:hypothetical protein
VRKDCNAGNGGKILSAPNKNHQQTIMKVCVFGGPEKQGASWLPMLLETAQLLQPWGAVDVFIEDAKSQDIFGLLFASFRDERIQFRDARLLTPETMARYDAVFSTANVESNDKRVVRVHDSSVLHPCSSKIVSLEQKRRVHSEFRFGKLAPTTIFVACFGQHDFSLLHEIFEKHRNTFFFLLRGNAPLSTYLLPFTDASQRSAAEMHEIVAGCDYVLVSSDDALSAGLSSTCLTPRLPLDEVTSLRKSTEDDWHRLDLRRKQQVAENCQTLQACVAGEEESATVLPFEVVHLLWLPTSSLFQNFPEHFHQRRQEWAELNPTVEVKLWSREDVVAAIEQGLGPDHAQVLESLSGSCQRLFAASCLVLLFGGLFAHETVVPNVPLDEWALNHGTTLLLPEGHTTLLGSATSHHASVQAVVDQTFRMVHTNDTLFLRVQQQWDQCDTWRVPSGRVGDPGKWPTGACWCWTDQRLLHERGLQTADTSLVGEPASSAPDFQTAFLVVISITGFLLMLIVTDNLARKPASSQPRAKNEHAKNFTRPAVLVV